MQRGRRSESHVSDSMLCRRPALHASISFASSPSSPSSSLSPSPPLPPLHLLARSLIDRIVAVCWLVVWGVSPDDLDGQREKTKQTRKADTLTNSERQRDNRTNRTTPTQPLHLNLPLVPSPSPQLHDGGAPTEIRTQAGPRPRSPHGHAAVRTTSTLVEEGRARERMRRGRGIEEASEALLAAFGCTARLAAAASVRVAPFVLSLFLFFDRPHLLLLVHLF